MVVFCHLRWQFVYQRPQHLISRMSRRYKVLLVEEPIGFHAGEEFTAQLSEVNPKLHILQPRVSRMEDIGELLKNYISNVSIPYAWFYSASFSSVLKYLEFETIIYDCMDELSLFKGAPQELIDQEQYLLKYTDVVFTGGKSLYESKSRLHHKVYCFPSSVDEQHFAKALNGLAVPEDIASIPHPIIGYFGVIDERIDRDLLGQAAANLTDFSFVMIGPLAKIEEGDLPRLPNIHYLGIKSYELLPAYLKAFDVAMMPFALNDATKYISPTKTLEYMAAGRPIISTRIKDVERDYSHCVRIVDNVSEFCDAVLKLTSHEFPGVRGYREILSHTSWDNTADKMQSIIQDPTS